MKGPQQTNSSGSLSNDSFIYLFPDAGLLAKLERMSLVGGSRVKGTLAGKRRSTSLGGSQEFADYRPYAPGDDVRRIDWNVYGRTGKPYLRQYWDEQELYVSLYIDVSRSMADFGGEHGNKLTSALRLAAAVGYAALCGGDRLAVRSFNGSMMDEGIRLAGGRASSLPLFQYLALQRPNSQVSADETTISNDEPAITDLSAAFRSPGRLPRRGGVSWVFTDGWYEQGIAETLLALKSAGQHVVFVQLLSPEEIEPRMDGELRLVDAEIGTGKEVALSAGSLRAYREALASYREELRTICANRGIPYVFIDTSRSLSDAVAMLTTIPNTLRH
ncbi:DUF58 domain-containing protein [Paenibacillus sp. strain BS8-2]